MTDLVPESEKSETFDEAVRRSAEIERDLLVNPTRYRVLTGDRPTGPLHIGHLFGSLLNRVKLQNLGVPTIILIADYQVFTDRDTADNISANVFELVLDYLSVGLDPFNSKTFIFCHSDVPELNQLLLPFLTLVSMPELDRNPTVKEEIKAAGLRTVQAIMYNYPVHQAADILFCHANVVPVGKDQLPHLELSRKIARRFNERFGKGERIFEAPAALLSDAPVIIGLDGTQKMSKSRENAIFLKDSEEVTQQKISKAVTDSQRLITYEPTSRPGVANLLKIASSCLGCSPETLADKIGDKGAGALKKEVTEALNSFLRPIRQKRKEFENNRDLLKTCLANGTDRAKAIAADTLRTVRQAMGMNYY